jgi:hypothetical protein
MDIYEVKFEPTKIKLRYRTISALCLSGIFFVVWVGLRTIWRSPSDGAKGLLGILVEGGLVSLFWGIAMVFSGPFRPGGPPSYRLLVDNDSITSVSEYKGLMKWLGTRRTVRKGQVRTIFEIKPRFGATGGVGVSERSKFGARMLGWVFLPRALPEFDYLKELAESWRNTGPR